MENRLPKAETTTPTVRQISVGVDTLRALMRRDVLFEDFKAETLRMIVREIYLAMEREPR